MLIGVSANQHYSTISVQRARHSLLVYKSWIT